MPRTPRLIVRMVQKAEDWKWSSLWNKKHGTEKQKSLLSSWPIEEPTSYLVLKGDLLMDENLLDKYSSNKAWSCFNIKS